MKAEINIRRNLTNYEDLDDLVGHPVHTIDPIRCGIIKGSHPSREDAVYVVFDCDGNWMEADNYPAELWPLTHLKDGWQ